MSAQSNRAATNASLSVVVVDAQGRILREPALAGWLCCAAPRSARGEIAIMLTSASRIRALNRRFRRVDAPTDVLSFPAEELDQRRSSSPADRQNLPDSRFLGDIVIARDVARRQAAHMRHSLTTELRVLALHGLLHLLGYDHETDGGRRMAALERRLLRRGGVGEGLIERSTARSGAVGHRTRHHPNRTTLVARGGTRGTAR